MNKCPNCGADLDYFAAQQKLADQALEKIDVRLQMYYTQQFGLGIGNNHGQFMGLVCQSCHRWQTSGHDMNCPVAELERHGGRI